MARIRTGEVFLGYETHGPEDGDKVVLLSGLGGTKEAWRFQVPALSEKFRVLTIDNRGVGESDNPDHPYTIQMFAYDAANVMAALGWDSAHIVGQSMGGMIAQEFAIAFPHKRKSVAILCSTPGGDRAVPPRREVLDLWLARDKIPPEEFEKKSAALGFSEEFRKSHPEVIEKIVEEELPRRPSEQVYRRHLEASLKHDATTRLRWIGAPTLVVHGTDDWLLPHRNGEVIAELINRARLHLFEGVGHAIGIERQKELDSLLIDWFEENS